MYQHIIKIFFLFMVFLMLPSFARAAISFDANGKWETTFDCAAQTQFVGALNCDGLEWAGNWYFDEHRTTIEAGANNPLGIGSCSRF
jgi:hypothetical protein